MVIRFLRIVVMILVPAAAALGTYIFLNRNFILPVDSTKTEPILFEISAQESFSQVLQDLENRGLIRHAWAFNIIAQLKGKDKTILAGEYELSPSMSPEEILEKFVQGKIFARRVTVKEGMSVWEIGALLEQAGIVSKALFEASLADPQLLKDLKIPGPSVEGYLFPETYQFPRNTPPRKIITTMVDEFKKRWTSRFDVQAQGLGLDRHKVIILASIVEKESGNFEEQPLIASVFLNRLRKNMKLQADPTVIYGIPNFNGNLTREDLITPTPYNTYVIDGLPPGPIGNPGMSAIQATLSPTQSEYLYFVANGNGSHVFSENLDSHNRNVNEFQKSPAKNPPSSRSAE